MLEISNVSHVYANGTRALDNVNLSIPRGMYGLLGPNADANRGGDQIRRSRYSR
jgi:ABC-type phosphate/phosphonate transport system ATPase subunit